MKLVIDRKEWLRGTGHGASRLLRLSDNKKCCLGFLALQCGFSVEEIKGKESPSCIRRSEDTIFARLQNSQDNVIENSDVCDNLMLANDSRLASDTERETEIAVYMKEIGVEVEFVN